MNIHYRSDREVGAEETLPNGQPVRYVCAKDYFLALLEHRTNATVVFIMALEAPKLAPEEIEDIDQALADAYKNRYQRVLTPPRIKELLRAATEENPSRGDFWLDSIDQIREAMMETEDLDQAITLHEIYRVQYLIYGTDRELSPFQASAGELMTDYLLIQRAIAADIERAEAMQSDGKTRAAVLAELDREADLLFETALQAVWKTQGLSNRIPQIHRDGIQEFARRREPYAQQGLLKYVRERMLFGKND